MKKAILSALVLVGAVSAFAESRSSQILGASADGSGAAIEIGSQSAGDSLNELVASTQDSSTASFSEGNAGRGLDVVGYGISGSVTAVAIGVRDSASQSGNTLSASTRDSLASTRDGVSAASNAVGNFSRDRVFPVSKQSFTALVGSSNRVIKLAVDSSGNVYTWSRDNVVQPLWGFSVNFTKATWNSTTASVRVLVSGETSQSVSGSVRDSATTVWDILVSASGEVSTAATRFSENPSQSIGQLVDDSFAAVRFVASNSGEVVRASGNVIVVSVDGSTTSGQNLGSAARNDLENISANLVTYSQDVSAISLSRGNKKLATVFFERPANAGHSRLYHR